MATYVKSVGNIWVIFGIDLKRRCRMTKLIRITQDEVCIDLWNRLLDEFLLPPEVTEIYVSAVADIHTDQVYSVKMKRSAE